MDKDSLTVRLPEVLYRYAPPGQYDHAPLGTLCKVHLDQKTVVYIQNSKDTDNPKWEPLD